MSDIAKLRSLRATLNETEQPGFHATDPTAVEACRADIQAIEAAWPDDRLLATFSETNAEAGDVDGDAMRAEITRRGLGAG